MEDLPRLLKGQDYKDFDNSKLVRDATKLFGRLSESHFILKPSEYTLIRDYLLSYLCINNASRTGAIAYMKRSEVKNPFRQSEKTMTVTVLDHKTLGPAGPAPLCMSLSTYRNLAIFSEKVRPSVYCLPEYRDYVFITTKGTMMESSQVTDQFNSFWNRAVGQTEIRKRVNGALVRKSTVTKVHATHPEMKSALATYMNHQEKTADESYRLQDKILVAGETHEKLVDILREVDNSLPMPSSSKFTTEEEVAQLLKDDEEINLEKVKNTLIQNNSLGKLDAKKIYNRVRYLRSKEKDTASLPVVEETTEQRVERLHQKQDEHPSETDSPFTEAGSSICTGRITYATIDKETIRHNFKDLIEDTRHITKAEVEQRINQEEALKEILTRYTMEQLLWKVRTERKSFNKKRKQKKRQILSRY